MTYQEALKARARVAYGMTGFTKRAADDDKKDAAPAAVPAATPEQAEAANAEAIAAQGGGGLGGAGDYFRDTYGKTPLIQPNVAWGAGTGAAAGLGLGAGAYGLMGLFPSLRKRRLLRALIALGVGGVGGAAAGYGVAKNYDTLKAQGEKAVAKGQELAGKGKAALGKGVTAAQNQGKALLAMLGLGGQGNSDRPNGPYLDSDLASAGK